MESVLKFNLIEDKSNKNKKFYKCIAFVQITIYAQ